jgi:hypothetical protein
MKAHKRLMQSIRDITRECSQQAFERWLRSRPGSVRRALDRGNITLDQLKDEYAKRQLNPA